MDFTTAELSDDSCLWPQNSDSLTEEISTVSELNGSSPVTPKSDTAPVAFNFDHGSSDISPDHDSDSSYSELDSETEAFYSSLNHHLVSPGAMDSHDSAADKQISYEELMKKYVQCEEELRTTSLKLKESEQEIEILKGEAEKGESAVLFAENLRAELETALRGTETRNIDIETERRRVLEMQSRVVDLETNLSDSNFKFENLANELELSRESLDVSEAEISRLRKLLCDCQQSFSTEKTKLQSDIAGLLENQTFFEARVKEIESRSEVLEDEILHSNAEKMEMQRKEVELQAEINALKTDLALRGKHIEALNKAFDNHKLRYDMLMAENDGVRAEVDKLKAEMRSRDIQIEQMEEELNQLRYTQAELESELGTANNTVVLQRYAISEGEEEKREAIRQLCFSLDHYKSGYRQLLWFLSNNNKQLD